MHLRLTKFPALQERYITPGHYKFRIPRFYTSSRPFTPPRGEPPLTFSYADAPAALCSHCHPPPPGRSRKRPFRQPAVQKQPRPLPEALLPHGALGRDLQQRPSALLPMRVATLGWTPEPQGDQPSNPATTTVHRICSWTPPCPHPQLGLSITSKPVGFIYPSESRVQLLFPLRSTCLTLRF